MPLHTDVPDELRFRGIEPVQEARGFAITLDVAEPWGGGRIEGRVERRSDRRDRRPVLVDVRCHACWLDVAPQLVGRKRLLSWSTYGDIRNRAVPIWLDDEVFRARVDVGALEDANWRHFSFDLPDGIVTHSRGVSRGAAEAARLLAAAGFAVDPQLVEVAALLHDVDKGVTLADGERHGVLAAQWMAERGFSELASLFWFRCCAFNRSCWTAHPQAH